MEQPKFRGYSLETNKWHYGHGWFKCDYTDEYKTEKGINDKAILYTDSSPIECELASMGQYTGIKDVNGKEAYAGDLFFWHGKLRQIVYREDKAAFMAKTLDSYVSYFHLKDIVGRFEIIDADFEYLLKRGIS